MATATDLVDHGLIFAGGLTAVLAAYYSRRSARASGEAAQASSEAASTSKEAHRELKSTTGKNASQNLEEVASELKLLRKDLKEVLAEQASLAVMFGAHLVDGHDPVGKMSQSHPYPLRRRIDDQREVT